MINPQLRNYDDVKSTVAALTEGESDAISLMATIACELFHAFDNFDWVGFYRVVESDLLKIGPYQGPHGCLQIAFSRGVCGACATSKTTQIIDDVENFPGHIACSSTTRSEIVLPVLHVGKLIAVLDIDSNSPAAFDQRDKHHLEAILAAAFS